MKRRRLSTLILAAALSAQGAFAADCGDLDVIYNLFDMSTDEVFQNGEGTPGPRRLVTEQTSQIISFTSKRFIQASPMDIDQLTVKIRKTDGSSLGGKTRFVICSIDEHNSVQELSEFDIAGTKKTVGETVIRELSGIKGKRLGIKLVGQSPTGNARFHIDLIRSAAEGKPWLPTRSTHSSPIPGFADLHVHQAVSLAFSGGWYWGSHEPGPLWERAPACDGHSHGNLSEYLSGAQIDLGSHEGQQQGYPDYADWPHWKDIKHQQVTEQWLREAHEGGLNLVVASAVNNQWLSAAMIASGNHNNRLSPADMEAVKRQVYSLKRMAEQSDWYTIVRDPWEARRAIEAGKLAVVLAVEVSDLLPNSDGDWRQQLYDLYDMGVRNIMLAHETNSRFSGAAFHEDTFKDLSKVKATFDSSIEYASSADGIYNQIGLSQEGRELLEEMIRLNMLIDLSHLPLKSQREIYQLVAERFRYYPLFNSHTRVRSLMLEKDVPHFKEHSSTDEVLGFIRDTGGIIGLRTGVEGVLTHQPAAHQRPIKNDCTGSSRSFAQSYQYADALGVAVAYGSDLNGFITQMPPRFGPEGCATQEDTAVRAQEQSAQGSTPDNDPFHVKGLAHIGYLPALRDDLQRLGADTENLDTSAEAFVKMWERAYDPQRIKAERRPVSLIPNKALGAEATASSSYAHYSPARINDGSLSTMVGGEFSWANAHPNAPGGALPQWVQLEFPVAEPVSQVRVYTTANYEIRDFDLEILENGIWQQVSSVRGNTAAELQIDLDRTYTANTLRLVGLQGPAKQPIHVRVNEIQVY